MSFFSFVKHIAQGDSKPGGGVFGFLNQAAQQTVNPISKLGNEGVALGQVLTGNQQAAQRTLAPGGGLGHQGGAVGGAEFGPDAVFATPQNVKKTIGVGASIGSNVAAPTLGFLGKGSVALRAVKGAAVGAPIGALGSAGQQLADTGQINPGQVLQGAAAGALLGGVAPVAGAAGRQFINENEIGAIGKQVTPPKPEDLHIQTNAGTIRISPEELTNISKAQTAGDVKKIVGDSLPPEIIDRIAPGLALAKDPSIIQNLIAKGVNDTLPSPTVAPEPIATPVEQPNVAGQGTSTAPNEAIRKHLQTISNAQSTGPELRDAIAGLKQTDEIRNTEKLSEEARKTVEKDYVGSLSDVLSSDNPSDKQIAIGEHLIVKAQQEGNIGQAVNVGEHLDNKLREHGRAIQAASVISRLSPEGRFLVAVRKVKRAREGSKNASKEAPTAKEIKQQLENSVPGFDRGSVGQAIKDISNDQQKLDLGGLEGPPQAVQNTGQKLAKNVEKAASPQVKKKADTLVQELTKKVKQEYLEPKTSIKKNPLDILKEVFGRTAEADEAYPLAQKILREKYASVPGMKEALDKFFGSKLDLPAASTTIDRALANQLKTNGEKVSDIIYKSLTSQEATVKNVANDLVKEGFDPQSATKLAEEVAKRLNKQVADAKISTLQRLSQKATPKNQATFIEKINKLSNLGALKDEDYLNLARAKLNLPHLTEESAQKISDLSQQIQEAPAGNEQYKLIRELHDEINANIPTSKGEIFRQIFAAPRASLSSGDLSGGGRQGAVLGARFPQEWGAAQKDSVKALKSQKFFDDKIAELNTKSDLPSEYLGLREKAGVAVAGGPDALHEEAFSSTLPEKLPGLGKIVEASDRAYTLGLSTLRDKTFEKIYREYENIKPMSTWTDEEIKSIGRFINTASGRGDLGKYLETHGKTLQEALFSPKLWKSRLDMINPYYYYSLKGPARKYAAQSAASFTGTAASIMALAVAAGAEVGTDARSSDFLKIKVGDTRFDIMGGLQQNLVFLHRELPGSIAGVPTFIGSGEKKSSQTGNITDLNAGGFGAANRLSIISDLFQSKENPSIAAITTQIKGQDKSGNQLTPEARAKEVVKLAVPLSIGDTYNNVTHSQNIAGGLAKSAPGFVGAGVNSYGTQDIGINGKQKTYLDSLKKQGAPEDVFKANESFFKSLKAAAGQRAVTSKAINEAIKNKDVAKAQSLAEKYNQSLSGGIAEWNSKYGQYANSDLQEAYNRQKIKLTGSSIRQRLTAQQSTKPF